MKRVLAIALLLMAAIMAAPAAAHLMPKQSGTMKITGKSANFVISVPVSAFDGIDPDGDGALSPSELNAAQQKIVDQFKARFHVSAKDMPGDPALTWVLSPQTDGSDTAIDYVVVLHRVFFADPPQNPSINTDLFGPRAGESQLSLRATRGDDVEAAVLTPSRSTHTFFVSTWAVLLDFVKLGIDHILTGYDHLLFLLTIVVAGAGLRYWIAVISSFTIAHSITLALGSLQLVEAPAALVEPAIALSIVVMAIFNIFQIRLSRSFGIAAKSAIVFACGLLHGLGFAGAIGAMQLSAGNWLASVAGFNIGIELGQMVFVILAILAGRALAHYGQQQLAKPLSLLACLIAAIVGAGLFAERVFWA